MGNGLHEVRVFKGGAGTPYPGEPPLDGRRILMTEAEFEAYCKADKPDGEWWIATHIQTDEKGR